MQKLISEYEKVKKHGFTLDFEYPTKAQRDHMNIVNRDMSAAEKDQVRKSKNSVANLIDGLESGQIYLEDLGEEQVLRLRALLEQREE